MLLFLTVLLLVHVGRAQQLNVSTYMIEQINGYRAQIAKGQMVGLGGTLPSTLSMFALEYDDFLRTLAEYNAMNCEPGATLIPSGESLNYHRASIVDDLSEVALINYVLAMWMDEMRQFSLDSQVMYNNQNMKEFANMIYYKSTRAGCSYQQCDGRATSPALYAIACAFDSEPQQNQPLYIAEGEGAVDGCEEDSDCSMIIANTVCGPQGLCGTDFATVLNSTTGTSSTSSLSSSTTGTGTSTTLTATTTGTSSTSSLSSSTTGTVTSTTGTATTTGTSSTSSLSSSTTGTGTSTTGTATTTGTSSTSSLSSSTTGTGTSTAGTATTSETPSTSSDSTSTTGTSTTGTATTNLSDFFVQLLNGYRAQLATGQLKVIGGVLPSTLQMFALKWDDNFLSTLAYYNTIGCQAPTLVPSGVSLSFHASTSVPGNDPKDMIRIVLSLWLNEETGSDLNGQVVYSSQSIKDFANMFYYKSTKVGCSYQTCSATNTMPAMYAVACAFNSAPQLGQPIYPANEGGAVLGCEVDSDCSDVFSGATCGSQHLCVPSST